LVDDYSKQYEFLSNIEQSHYRNYEKTIITLSSTFLAFSVSFLGLIRKQPPLGETLPALDILVLPVLSWVLFMVSIFSILISFLTNAIALRIQVGGLEYLIEGDDGEEQKEESQVEKSPDKSTKWIWTSCCLFCICLK